jgi:hypothetical protein
MKIVNGHVCATSCDERVARRGVDPRNPREDPVKQAALDAQAGKPPPRAGTISPDAVSFGGALSGMSAGRSATAPSFGGRIDVAA